MANSNQGLNNKILGFLGLPQGWHYGEGNSPSEETITRSIQINNEANLLALKTEAFPGINGEILFIRHIVRIILKIRVKHTGQKGITHY